MQNTKHYFNNEKVNIPEEAPEDAIGDKVSSGKVEAV